MSLPYEWGLCPKRFSCSRGLHGHLLRFKDHVARNIPTQLLPLHGQPGALYSHSVFLLPPFLITVMRICLSRILPLPVLIYLLIVSVLPNPTVVFLFLPTIHPLILPTPPLWSSFIPTVEVGLVLW